VRVSVFVGQDQAGLAAAAAAVSNPASAGYRYYLSPAQVRAGQVVPSRAMSVPAALASAITTIRVSTATVAPGPHEPLKAANSAGLIPAGWRGSLSQLSVFLVAVPGRLAALRFSQRLSGEHCVAVQG
jgi:hypothetical protein